MLEFLARYLKEETKKHPISYRIGSVAAKACLFIPSHPTPLLPLLAPEKSS
jgi:hypothetical protein